MKEQPVGVAAPPCYFRGDVGYSWSSDPGRYVYARSGHSPPPFVTDADTCASTTRGSAKAAPAAAPARAASAAKSCWGYHGRRNIDGTPFPVNPATTARRQPTIHRSPPTMDVQRATTTSATRTPVHTLRGRRRGPSPQRGGGVTLPTSVNHPLRRYRWLLAWSLMAGVGVQVTERATLDIGYRYLDMGKADSGTTETSGFANNPRWAWTTSPRTSSRSACAFPSAAEPRA